VADLDSTPGVVRSALLIEDDEGDAFLVRELLADVDPSLAIEWVHSLEDAKGVLPGAFHCVLIDLGLPDASGLDGLVSVLQVAPDLPVIVLTGLAQEGVGVKAVAIGAQDYLIKGQVDGPLLSRSLRYAVERKQADLQLRRLHASELLAAENQRLEWGLLPLPITHDSRLRVVTRYESGREGVLGGDFFDVVETSDGWLHLLIGDVSGHGTDEAALGVAIRIAWRTLVLAGIDGQDVLPILDALVIRERRNDETFATLCALEVEPDRRLGRLYLAGHPAPLVLGRPMEQMADDLVGPPLGMLPGVVWGSQPVSLPEDWRIMIFTDGLVEGRVDGGPDRLGVGRLAEIATTFAEYDKSGRLIDHLIMTAQHLHGGALSDDVAVVVVECRR
jgi:serine phosphatase RsbU (regulator of sigma subunit)